MPQGRTIGAADQRVRAGGERKAKVTPFQIWYNRTAFFAPAMETAWPAST